MTTPWFSCDASNRVHQLKDSRNSTLARGSFGEVRIAIDKEYNKLIVIKIILQAYTYGVDGSKHQLRQVACNEILALRILNGHSNIVPFLGLTESEDRMLPHALCLAFEYCPIDLSTVITRFRFSIPFKIIRLFTRDILSALHHCHSHGIIHRDVTPRNLLISSRGRIYLGDFGLCKLHPNVIDKHIANASNISDEGKALCTLYYRAPEILLGGPALDESIDMYSVGLVLAEIINGRALFSGKNVLDQIHRTFQILGTPSGTEDWVQNLHDFSKVVFRKYEPQPLENILPRAMECPDLLSLLNSLIVLDPRQRISAETALQHPVCQHIPSEISAIEFIPTEYKSVIFHDSSIEIAESEALSIAMSRRTCKIENYNTRIRTIEEVLFRKLKGSKDSESKQ